ncbi:MAG: ABATE domain-containing protein [Candidatus Eremiobacteraeota bacterium]|nr:ABATE domain-containing protein [Candidatus Eremiobacteraeota bacterium]
MTDERPEPFFIAGAAGLDFLNSVATPIDVPVEWLASGNDLLRWLEKAALIPSHAARELRKNALPGELDTVATQARELREWFRAFVLAHKGKPLAAGAVRELEPLNRLLARDEQYGEVVANPLRLERRRRWRSPDALLFPIATALAELLSEVDFADVKACEGAQCSLLYVDRTRTRGRRWCSMAVCGNRSKQAAHRVKKVRRR